MKNIFFTLICLLCFSAGAGALDINNVELDKGLSDKVAVALSNAKKTKDVGVIKKEHVKYMGKTDIVGITAKGCEDEAQIVFLKRIVSQNPAYSQLDHKKAIFVSPEILAAKYMPWNPDKVESAIYDPDLRGMNEIDINRSILLGLVYPSGDAFVLSQAERSPRTQFRVYHYEAIKHKTGNKPFTELSGYDESINYKKEFFKQCQRSISVESVGISSDYLRELDMMQYPLNKEPSYLISYYNGNDFRNIFIKNDEKIEDIYPQTNAEKLAGFFGINKSRKTDKVIKNVLAAKRVGNTLFLTLSKIGGKYYIHLIELSPNKRQSKNLKTIDYPIGQL